MKKVLMVCVLCIIGSFVWGQGYGGEMFSLSNGYFAYVEVKNCFTPVGAREEIERRINLAYYTQKFPCIEEPSKDLLKLEKEALCHYNIGPFQVYTIIFQRNRKNEYICFYNTLGADEEGSFMWHVFFRVP